MSDAGTVQSVERTFLLIELLGRFGTASITALAKESGLHKTTVHRLLATLCTLGYVRQDPVTGHYALTLRLFRLTAETAAGLDLRRLVAPYLNQLAKNCGETVHLVQREGDSIVYIDKFEAPASAVRMGSHIGLALPLCRTAVGKALLAQLSNDEVLDIFSRFDCVPKTSHTITNAQELLRQIEGVRQSGYALDNEENELGVRCIATVLPGVYGGEQYAISISAPAFRFGDSLIAKRAEQLHQTVAAILNA